jgi:hypothetical protein
MTKLTAVNAILRRVGGYPVTTLDPGGASTASEAERCLDEANLQIQSRGGVGWHFNRTYDVVLTPGTGGYIAVPSGCITLDAMGISAHRDITHRGERVYDLEANTEVFDAPVTVEIVSLWEFHCIPEPVADYIVAKATVQFNEIRGNRERTNVLMMELDRAMKKANSMNNRQADSNFLDSNDSRDVKGRRNDRRRIR